MPALVPRETPEHSSSQPHDQCKPVSESVKLCAADVIAIVAVAFFIWYAVWGIPMTARACKAIYAKLYARRMPRKTRIHLNDDLEKGMAFKGCGPRNSKVYLDPYLSPSKRLQTFLVLNSQISVPQRAYNPKPEDTEQIWIERERLDSFKFPRTLAQPSNPPEVSSPEMSEVLSISSISGLYSPPSKADIFDYGEPSSPALSTFPSPPGLTRLSELNSLELDVLDGLAPLPSSPPPAYLDYAFIGRVTSICKPCSW
ncbi:hypothetical protein OH77DRAFT_1435808 [Trametes cingulata]|nr:hypothetical protein OH77DRAFT_1435808 [Trametes cingulata]